MTFVAIVILFGHWLDYYQQVFASLFPQHVEMSIFDYGVAAGFVGLIMYSVANALTKSPLLAKNHPFVKESIIHHT